MWNRPYGFEIYLVNVKTIRTIVQIFVDLSEKLNFTSNYLDSSNLLLFTIHWTTMWTKFTAVYTFDICDLTSFCESNAEKMNLR